MCLTPSAGRRGVVISWQQHDRMSVQQTRGAAMDAAVQRTMNAAIADLLAQAGSRVEPFGAASCSLVTALEWES